MTSTIGIDIGGTSIRAAVVDETGQIVDSARTPTPKSVPALERALDLVVARLRADHEIAAVGLAVAGFLTADREIVVFAPHLPWRDAHVGRDMSARIGLPVVVEHDANSAAWAEYRFGAAAPGQITVVVALGTGIGAGLLINGELFRGSHGVAPELGHLQVVPGGRQCACGKQGCWERYCSGTALVDTTIELLAQDSDGILARESAADPAALTGRRVAAAAMEGDRVALAAFADLSRWLGVGLAMIADVFDPDLIVIAGGVGASSTLYLDDAREAYANNLTGGKYRRRARIRATQLGEAAGMVGAANLALRAITDPLPTPAT